MPTYAIEAWLIDCWKALRVGGMLFFGYGIIGLWLLLSYALGPDWNLAWYLGWWTLAAFAIFHLYRSVEANWGLGSLAAQRARLHRTYRGHRIPELERLAELESLRIALEKRASRNSPSSSHELGNTTQDEKWEPSKDMQDRLSRYEWKKRRAEEHGHSNPVRESRDEQSARSPDWPKPAPLLHPNPENFEELCAAWCRYLGYVDAVKTQNSRDGGIDIKGSGMIAQVKFQVSPVGVRPIRELNGVRELGQEVLFFALNGFTPEARREATQMGFTLIKVAPLEGQIDILA